MLENHENCTRHIYSAKEKLAVRCKSSPQKYPTHLYIRGEFFYYRRRIPKKYSSYNETTEIRFSLQTDSFREAREKTTFITASLHSLFQEKGMVTSEDMAKMKLFLEKECPQFVTPQKSMEYQATVVDIHAWLNTHGHDYTLDEIANIFHLKYALISLPYFPKEKLSIILDGKNKVQLTYDEISKRLVGHFRHALSCDAQNPNSRTLYENRKLSQPLLDMSTPEQMGITTNSLYSLLLTHHKSLIDNPPLLCLHCMEFLETLIDLGVFKIEELSYENHLSITNAYCKISIDYIKILKARLEKDYSEEKSFFTLPYTPYPDGTDKNIVNDLVQQTIEDIKKDKLSIFLDDYLETKVKDGKKDIRYIPELRQHIELFVRIIGDKPIDSYTRKYFRDFRDNLSKLPPNFSKLKKFKNKNIQEILGMKHDKTLAIKTINGYLVDISAFFNWLVVEGFLLKNNATGLIIKEKQSKIDSRDPFSLEDIGIIFNSNKLKAFKESKKPSRYWVPWIGLYTGMRVEEICQLHCSDIYEIENDLWVIDVNEKKGKNVENTKNLKTLNAKRLIPVHNHLKIIGLLEYLETVKKDNERLFPDLKALGDRKQYGKAISKDFGPFVRELGIMGKKSFHSLRHSFSDFFKERLLQNSIFEQTFGHSHEKLATSRYGDRFTPQQCYEKLISILDYGLQ